MQPFPTAFGGLNKGLQTGFQMGLLQKEQQAKAQQQRVEGIVNQAKMKTEMLKQKGMTKDYYLKLYNSWADDMEQLTPDFKMERLTQWSPNSDKALKDIFNIMDGDAPIEIKMKEIAKKSAEAKSAGVEIDSKAMMDVLEGQKKSQDEIGKEKRKFQYDVALESVKQQGKPDTETNQWRDDATKILSGIYGTQTEFGIVINPDRYEEYLLVLDNIDKYKEMTPNRAASMAIRATRKEMKDMLEEENKDAEEKVGEYKDKVKGMVEDIKSGKVGPKKSPEPQEVSATARRFRNDPAMKDYKLGKWTSDGYEVYDKNGKMIGHYE